MIEARTYNDKQQISSISTYKEVARSGKSEGMLSSHRFEQSTLKL